MKQLSVALGTLVLLGGCSSLLGLDDYEVGDDGASGGGGNGGVGGTGGSGGSDGGSGGGSNGGSAGSAAGNGGGGGSEAGGGGDGGNTNTSTGGNGGSGGDGTGGVGTGGVGTGGVGGVGGGTTTMGEGGGGNECGCGDQRDPCLTATCVDDECVDMPKAIGSACILGDDFSGVCNASQECVICVDDEAGSARDSGCPETARECDDSQDPPVCTGCSDDEDCNDSIVCTTDACVSGSCQHQILPAGSECAAGVCNGQGSVESCVPCLDDETEDVDSGCSQALPLCNTTATPSTCVECIGDEDCDDTNDCTTDACSAGTCSSETVEAGTECLGGVCNGVEGQEACGACIDDAGGTNTDLGCEASAPVCDMTLVPAQCTGCIVNGDCNDGLGCTTDTCNGSGVCEHEPDDSACAESSDVCQVNQCIVGTGCTPIDNSDSVSLLVDGAFDAPVDAWIEVSYLYYNLIVPQGYANVTVLANTPPQYAWLGGMYEESSELLQLVSVPSGAQTLDLTFYDYRSSDSGLADDYNVMGASLLDYDLNLLHDFVIWGNQDAPGQWERFPATGTASVDARDWAGTDVYLYFWAFIGPAIGSGANEKGISSFFLDTVSLTATVCE